MSFKKLNKVKNNLEDPFKALASIALHCKVAYTVCVLYLFI